ncbi:hypothetical protein [Azospirillum sp. TSH100]|uniref:hypothetical protein n=1 Tax=Azospirillum sp. TSH100 TaxID=652764 RepID=UPI001304C3B2|nr:hypothetical protein [Azospirillum sp. TSH100]
MDVFRYQYGGLVLQSAAALPLAPDIDPDRPADVTVTFGPLPIPTADCVRAKPHFQMHADGTCILRTLQGIRFLFDNGRALRVEVPDGLDRRLVRSWLIGPGLGILLHQRGLPPLHACAVTLGERAVAIAGDSGAGKSTTARALMQRGHRLLAEDQAVIDPVTGRVWPGAPDLRLWAEAAGAFGDPMTEDTRLEAGEDKFTIASDRLFDPRPRPLAALFVLSSDHAVERPVAERLGSAAATASLHRYVYRLRLATFMGATPVIFHWAAALTAGVPVFALRRPRDLSRLDELAAHIERITENGA